MGEKFSVILSGPAKVGGKRYKSGAPVEVDQDQLDQLMAAGVLETHPKLGGEHADTATLMKRAEDPAGNWMETSATKDRKLAEALARVSELEAERDELAGQIAELQAELTALRTVSDEASSQTPEAAGATDHSEDTPPSGDDDTKNTTPPKKPARASTRKTPSAAKG